MSIDWTEAVKEYKKQYPDEPERLYNIFEFIDGYLPIYNGEIIKTYGRIYGSPLGIEIIEGMVGATISQILVAEIQEAYVDEFMEAWNEAEEEE